MKIFKINEKIEIICEWKKTRTAFKHEATLMINGSEYEKTKLCYLNRTWERYEYESVLYHLVEKSKVLSDAEKVSCKDFIKHYGDKDRDDMLKSVAMVAKLGDIFCKDQKDKNDWKARMLKTGLENKGLIVPEDWEQLSEDEKESRLNKIIEFANKGDD